MKNEVINYECDLGCIYTESEAIQRVFVCDNCDRELKEVITS